jgi:hypothetical protein
MVPPAQRTAWSDCMQALSHYSFHTNDRRAMLCDLQGAVYKDGFIITDPVIMSTTQEYGPTDLGPKGISTFFAHHRCNSYCRQHWIVPNDVRAYFPMKKGSSMVQHLPTRHTRAPLTHFNQIEEGDEDY